MTMKTIINHHPNRRRLVTEANQGEAITPVTTVPLLDGVLPKTEKK
jgi:hypothetical protein